MNKHIRDNLAKFFYDTAKLCMAILVLGLVTHQPFPMKLFAGGIVLTLIFLSSGVMMDSVVIKEK